MVNAINLAEYFCFLAAYPPPAPAVGGILFAAAAARDWPEFTLSPHSLPRRTIWPLLCTETGDEFQCEDEGGMSAKRSLLASAGLACAGVFAAGVAVAEEFKLPPEVTPQLRAACETDVRRLCIGPNPTVSKVKRCVLVKYFQLGKKCQVELASLGFGP